MIGLFQAGLALLSVADYFDSYRQTLVPSPRNALDSAAVTYCLD